MSTILEGLRQQRKTKVDELNKILQPAGPDGEVRTADLSEEEDQRTGALLADIARLDERIDDLAELAARDEIRAAGQAELNHPDKAVESFRVTNEPETYTPQSGNQWISDAYRSQFNNDRHASERLERYARENEVNKRDIGSAAFGALVPPQYLLDQFALNLRAGRPTANAITSLTLPSVGMTMTVPRGTGLTLTDVQTAELTDVAEADFDETPLTIPVITVAGQQDVSRQALERGEGTDQILFADLSADFANKVDREVIAGTGVGGHAVGITATGGINVITYTSGTPNVGELWGVLSDAISRINGSRYLPATHIIMHPRRWGGITAARDTTGRPLFGGSGGGTTNAIANGTAAMTDGVVGEIQGLPIVVDANLATNLGAGTNQDSIIVMRAPDLLLWEENGGRPRELRFEETNASKLAVKVVVYGYMAFTAGRYPQSVAMITGTGLVPPTF